MGSAGTMCFASGCGGVAAFATATGGRMTFGFVGRALVAEFWGDLTGANRSAKAIGASALPWMALSGVVIDSGTDGFAPATGVATGLGSAGEVCGIA